MLQNQAELLFSSDYRDRVRAWIVSSAHLEKWPEHRDELLGFLNGQPDWAFSIPASACLAVGGSAEAAMPVTVAWLMLHHAAHLLDGIQDGHFTADQKETINQALMLVFAAYDILATGQPKNMSRIIQEFAQAGLDSALGQQNGFDLLEGISPSEALERYWQATIQKSGSIFRAGAAAGAAAGTDHPAWIESLGDYGTALGVILQILDDCRDMVDPTNGKVESSLPILLYAIATDQPLLILPNSSTRGVLLTQLHEAGIPQVIAEILAEWQRRGEESLGRLEENEPVRALREVLARRLKSSAAGFEGQDHA